MEASANSKSRNRLRLGDEGRPEQVLVLPTGDFARRGGLRVPVRSLVSDAERQPADGGAARASDVATSQASEHHEVRS